MEQGVAVIKPRLGQKVYCIDKKYSVILEERVGYLGKEAFVIDFDDGFDINYLIYNYKDYGETWCKTLKEAKAEMQIDEDEKFVKYTHGKRHTWWEVEVKA